jgi:enamine deaminase RidA (YjgF/YER057c/UK114 family)
MPASTGIGAPNPMGAALIAKVIAIKPKTQRVAIRRIESPLQCEALKYGSAFSRGIEVTDPAGRMLHISGTASIEPNGATAFSEDASKQIHKTMEVVEAMLAYNGMDLSDTTRAIAYFRRRQNIPLWWQYWRARDMAPIPTLLAESVICRDDLLFEIELDAAREN